VRDRDEDACALSLPSTGWEVEREEDIMGQGLYIRFHMLR